MDVTVSVIGTDDALLSSGTTPYGIVEGEDSCSNAAHCYVSADALQTALGAGNVTLSVGGTIFWSGAPSDGDPLSSSTSAILTLRCGSAGSSADALRLSADLEVPNGAVVIENLAADGGFCLLGSSAATGGSDPSCSNSGGSNDCSGNGLICLQAAELQRVSAASLRLANAAGATGTHIVVNGLAAADIAGVSETLALWAQAESWSGDAQEQVLFAGAASAVSCALDVRAYSGVTLGVALSCSGGTGGGNVYVDGDSDGATNGGLVFLAPASGAMVTSAGKITLAGATDAISYGGTGNLELRANAGIEILASVTPSVSNREVILNADADGAGAGTLKLAAGVTVGSFTTARTVTLTAADIDFGSDSCRIMNSGSYNMWLYVTNGRPIGVGVDVSAQGGMSMSASEVKAFQSSRLCIGDGAHGGIFVGALSASHTDNVQTWCFRATAASGTGGTVSFQDGASTFRVLEVIARLGIYFDVPETNGVTTTYFTGTLDLEITGSASDGAVGIVFRNAQYLNAATKLTLKSEVGATGDATLFLNAGAGVTLDCDLRMNASDADMTLQINADTDFGGQGTFVLCGGDADDLAQSSEGCVGTDRTITAISATGFDSAVRVISTQIIIAGRIDGGTGTVQLAPSQAQAIAVGDEALIAYTIEEVELNRVATTGTLIVGSDEVILINVAGLNHTRTGPTEIRCRSASCYIMVYRVLDPVTAELGRNVTFAGPLSLIASDGIFVTTATLDVGGGLTVDANYDSAGAEVFFCPDGNKKPSCTSDNDCSRNLCGDGVTFCDGGQSECTGTLCFVPSAPGRCASQAHFLVNQRISLASGSLDVTADTITINSTAETYPPAIITLGTNGAAAVRPKTARRMRLGLHSGLEPYGLYVVAGKEMEVAQATLDRIETTGQLTIGGSAATTVWMRGVTRNTVGGLYVEATNLAGAKIDINASGCASEAACAVSTLGPLSLTTTGVCNLLVDISTQFLLGTCGGGTTQTGLLTITGTGRTLRYEAVGDLVVTGAVINQDPIELIATGDITVASSLTAKGMVTITADSDGDGVGSFTLGANTTIASRGHDIVVTCFDADIGGKLDAYHNAVIFRPSAADAWVGLNSDVGSAGLSLSATELRQLTGRDLVVGGARAGVLRADSLQLDMLPGMDGVLRIEALGSPGAVLLNRAGEAAVVRALDVRAAANVTLWGNLTTSVGAARLRAGSASGSGATGPGLVWLSTEVGVAAQGNLELDAGEPGAINLTTPTALLAGRDLVLQSNTWIAGEAGATAHLGADADADNDGALELRLGKTLTLPRGVANGTLLVTAERLRIGPGAVDMDEGALLVSSARGFSGTCARVSKLDVRQFNAEPHKFRVGSGAAFFEPVPATLDSARRASDSLLLHTSGVAERPPRAAAEALSTRTPTVLTLAGRIVDSIPAPPVEVYVGALACAPQQLTHAPSASYAWTLLNGSTLQRFVSDFSMSCAVSPGLGASLPLQVQASCGADFMLHGFAGHPSPRVRSIVPNETAAPSAVRGGEIRVTILGENFGSACSDGCVPHTFGDVVGIEGVACRCGDKGIRVWLESTTEEPGTGRSRREGLPGEGEGEVRACERVEWTSDSSVACLFGGPLALSRGLPWAEAIVQAGGQRGRGGAVRFKGGASWAVSCAGAAVGTDCPSGRCAADCRECCRRECQRQWEDGESGGEGLDARAPGVVGDDSYAHCAVLCADFCAAAPDRPSLPSS